MTDRERFKENLNYYLLKSGKMQKDLAEYVGAKTTTVSGWTRGVSYPRSDAMEKIAMFFGISTSRLVGEREDEAGSQDNSDDEAPEIRIVSGMMQTLPKEQQEQIVAIVRTFVTNHPRKDDEDDNET